MQVAGQLFGHKTDGATIAGAIVIAAVLIGVE